MREPFKILGIFVIVVILAGVGAYTWITISESAAVDRAQARLDSAQQDQILEEQRQASILRLVEMTVGPIGKATMKVCFAEGYPRNNRNLSRREIAECNDILAKANASSAKTAAEEKRKDAEYDKQHPAGK